MFICAITKKTSKSGESATRIVTETRIKEYFVTEKQKQEDGTYQTVTLKVGEGTEIVKEILVSNEGLKMLGYQE